MPIGARLNSLGNASVSVSDAFSVFSNPATLSGLSKPTAALFVDHRYNVSGLNTMAFAYNHAIKNSRIALGMARFGDELLNHSRIELAMSHKVRMVSLGGGIGVHQLTVSENGVARAITLQFGGTAELTPKLIYGAHVYNMFRSKVAKESSLYYPVLMKTGFSYLPIQQVILTAEVEKDSRFEPNFKTGIEYKPTEWLFLRTGINTNPSNGFLGFGFKHKVWSFDYGISVQNRLGVVHYLSLVFALEKKKTNDPTP